MKLSTRYIISGSIALIVVTGGLLSACSGLTNALGHTVITNPVSELVPSDSVPTDGHSKSTEIFSVKTGDCILDTAEGDVSDVPTVACTTPHSFEVFRTFTAVEDSYPGDAVLTAEAEKACTKDAFTSFVGKAFDDSELNVNDYRPTASSWAHGDRTIDCLVAAASGLTTGTLKGANR
jgi:hypothetical protein